jgi:hypothetical protein
VVFDICLCDTANRSRKEYKITYTIYCGYDERRKEIYQEEIANGTAMNPPKSFLGREQRVSESARISNTVQ